MAQPSFPRPLRASPAHSRAHSAENPATSGPDSPADRSKTAGYTEPGWACCSRLGAPVEDSSPRVGSPGRNRLVTRRDFRWFRSGGRGHWADRIDQIGSANAGMVAGMPGWFPPGAGMAGANTRRQERQSRRPAGFRTPGPAGAPVQGRLIDAAGPVAGDEEGRRRTGRHPPGRHAQQRRRGHLRPLTHRRPEADRESAGG